MSPEERAHQQKDMGEWMTDRLPEQAEADTSITLGPVRILRDETPGAVMRHDESHSHIRMEYHCSVPVWNPDNEC